MPNTYRKAVKAAAAPTSLFKPSKSDQETIAHVRKEFERSDNLLEETRTLKERFATLGQDFAKGKIDLVTAAGLIACGQGRTEIAGGLRHHVKSFQKELLATIEPIVRKARQHAADEIRDKCQTLEKTERQSSAELGVHPDEFQPSGLLESLREQHRRLLDRVDDRVTRTDLGGIA